MDQTDSVIQSVSICEWLVVSGDLHVYVGMVREKHARRYVIDCHRIVVTKEAGTKVIVPSNIYCLTPDDDTKDSLSE